MIRLFEIQNGAAKPTEHCYTIPFLRDIMDTFPDSYMSVYAYVFYMSCPGEDNPFRNTAQHALQRKVLHNLRNPDLDPDHPIIKKAVDECIELYDTASARAFRGIKTMMDRLAFFFENEPITAGGREGNLGTMVNSAKQFDQLRKSFKGIVEDLDEEQKALELTKSKGRGGGKIAYDMEDDEDDDYIAELKAEVIKVDKASKPNTPAATPLNEEEEEDYEKSNFDFDMSLFNQNSETNNDSETNTFSI